MLIIRTLITQVGNTPLHFAVHSGHLPIVEYLIEQAGANVHAKTDVRILAMVTIACDHLTRHLV